MGDNMDCKYTINIPSVGICCKAYCKSKRKERLFWLHFPSCSEENCPLIHPELLEEATLTEKGGVEE